MVIPRHSPFRKNMDWLDTNFPREVKKKNKQIHSTMNSISGNAYSIIPIEILFCIISSQIRTHSILYEADNVLTPEVIQAIYKQRKLLQNLKTGNKSFQVRISTFDVFFSTWMVKILFNDSCGFWSLVSLFASLCLSWSIHIQFHQQGKRQPFSHTYI